MNKLVPLKELGSLYQDEPPYLRTLLLGEPGVGKTFALKTLPKPILLYSLDPAGEVSILNDDGSVPDGIIIDNRWQDTTTESFKGFTNDFSSRLTNGDFEQMGSVVIDSFTSYMDLLINSCMEAAGPKADGRQTWGEIFSVAIHFFTKAIAKVPAHFVTTGHLAPFKDDLTGEVVYGITSQGQTSSRLPDRFGEVLHMMSKRSALKADSTAADIERYFVTANNGKHKAKARISRGGLLNVHEVPDFKAIIEKVGLDASDKPLI